MFLKKKRQKAEIFQDTNLNKTKTNIKTFKWFLSKTIQRIFRKQDPGLQILALLKTFKKF